MFNTVSDVNARFDRLYDHFGYVRRNGFWSKLSLWLFLTINPGAYHDLCHEIENLKSSKVGFGSLPKTIMACDRPLTSVLIFLMRVLWVWCVFEIGQFLPAWIFASPLCMITCVIVLGMGLHYFWANTRAFVGTIFPVDNSRIIMAIL